MKSPSCCKERNADALLVSTSSEQWRFSCSSYRMAGTWDEYTIIVMLCPSIRLETGKSNVQDIFSQ